MAGPGVSFDFSGANVLVTGGTSGIGAAVASAYQRAGAHVIITGTRASLSEYVEAPQSRAFRQLNLADTADIDRLAAEFSELDILVNNAGGAQESEDFDEAVAINLVAVQRLSTRLKPALSNSRFPGGASIINIASMMSFYGSVFFPGYSAAKGGLLLLTKSLAGAWAKEGVRVNAVAPGAIRTPMTKVWADHPEYGRRTAANAALGRWGEPDDVAGPILFLTSPAAGFITGETLIVGGGYRITG